MEELRGFGLMLFTRLFGGLRFASFARTAALRHEAMANAGRIRPQTARLRIDELAATVPVDIRTSQIEGTRTRIETGKASLPTPE